MPLGDDLGPIEQRELECGKAIVERGPPAAARLVVLHELRERLPREVASGEQVALVGVADEPHRVSSATACAASPSPRPVKPRRSLVVARTAIRGTSTSSASASRRAICSRYGWIRGCSPIRTQSAFTSWKPDARTRP